jgi:mono/diheme cytochrome c family protein
VARRIARSLAVAIFAVGIAISIFPAHGQGGAPDGKALYEANCAPCHLEDGTGSPGLKKNDIPDFTNPAFHSRHDAEEIREAVADGKGQIMPSFKDRLTPEEIAAIGAYVQGFPARSGKSAAPSVRPRSSDDDDDDDDVDHKGRRGRGRGRGRGGRG